MRTEVEFDSICQSLIPRSSLKMEVISLLLQNAKLCCGNPIETQQCAWPLVDRLRDNE